MQKHWPQMRCPKYLCVCSNKQQYRSDCLPLRFYSFLPSTMVSMYLQTTASPEEELVQVYVRVRAITCPTFQCFACLCEIMSTKCQSSCISKHSYMHNHVSYVFMHLVKLSCYSYAFAFSIPMSISVKINHVNFKFLLLMTNVYLSYQFQNPTILSTSNFSYPFKFKLLPSCQVNVNLFLQYNSFPLTAKWLVRIQEELVPANSLLLSVKQQVHIQEQLVLVNLFLLSVK